MIVLGGGAAARRGSVPAALHVYVEDCDAAYRRALEAGALTLMGPAKRWRYSKARGASPEDVRRQIFGVMTIAHAPYHPGVHAVEILFAEVAKARRVALRGFNPRPVVGALRHRLLSLR